MDVDLIVRAVADHLTEETTYADYDTDVIDGILSEAVGAVIAVLREHGHLTTDTDKTMGRRINRSDLETLTGLHVQVDVQDCNTGERHMEQGFIASAGVGAFGGLFVEFAGGDTSIGWNPEDLVSLYVTGDVRYHQATEETR